MIKAIVYEIICLQFSVIPKDVLRQRSVDGQQACSYTKVEFCSGVPKLLVLMKYLNPVCSMPISRTVFHVQKFFSFLIVSMDIFFVIKSG